MQCFYLGYSLIMKLAYRADVAIGIYKTHTLCSLLSALYSLPSALCPMLYALCSLPYALCLLHGSKEIIKPLIHLPHPP